MMTDRLRRISQTIHHSRAGPVKGVTIVGQLASSVAKTTAFDGTIVDTACLYTI
jgi:hypothetical protein